MLLQNLFKGKTKGEYENKRRLHVHDTYQVYIKTKPSQVLYIKPDEGTCQIIQMLPNSSQPFSQFCPIAVHSRYETVGSVYVTYGVMKSLIPHCPFHFFKSHNEIEITFESWMEVWKRYGSLLFNERQNQILLTEKNAKCPQPIARDSPVRIPECPYVIYKSWSGTIVTTGHNLSQVYNEVLFYKETLFPFHVTSGNLWKHTLMTICQISLNRTKMNNISLKLSNDHVIGKKKPINWLDRIKSIHLSKDLYTINFRIGCSNQYNTQLTIKWKNIFKQSDKDNRNHFIIGHICIIHCAPISSCNTPLHCSLADFTLKRCQEIMTKKEGHTFKMQFPGLMNCYPNSNIYKTVQTTQFHFVCGQIETQIKFNKTLSISDVEISKTTIPYKSSPSKGTVQHVHGKRKEPYIKLFQNSYTQYQIYILSEKTIVSEIR